MLNQLLNRNPAGHSATKTGLNLIEWAPINKLPKRYQEEILNRSEVLEYASGDIIFKAEDADEKDYYLIEGAVELTDAKGSRARTIEHSGQQSLELFDHNKPRKNTAKATQNCKIFVTRRTFFDTLNSANQGKQALPEVEVSEVDLESSGNWMLHMLNSSVFARLPPENLQKIFISMDSVKVISGTTIVEQGETGQYFYLIQHGDCVITRQNDHGEKKELCRLTTGETFGERSLISNEPSDVAIEMASDGVVTRISKTSFNELVSPPLLDQVSVDEANLLIEQGACWIDVRNAAQYRKHAIKDSINIDLDNLYTAIKGLSTGKKYILCGNSASHATTSAFLLSIKGFIVHSLSVSVADYLESHAEAVVSVQQVEIQEIPEPVLETTVGEEELHVITALEATADQPPQIKFNTAALTENIQSISRELELQIREEIKELTILKQKELELEVSEKFRKYHLVTARIMKKKLDELEQVYQVQTKLIQGK